MKSILNVAFIAIAFVGLLSSCSKDSNNTTPQNTDPDYYVKYNFQGQQYYLDNDVLQVGHSSVDEFGGWGTEGSLFTGDGVKINIVLDTVVDSIDVKQALVGQRFYFNGYGGPYPSANMVLNWDADYRYDEQVQHQDYYVEFTSIDFLRNENALFDYDIYAVRGVFFASMEDNQGGYADADGEFYIQMSHSNFD